MTEKTNDASLIRCTVKKSIDVTKKLGKIGIALGLIGLLGYVVLINLDYICSNISNILNNIWNTIYSGITLIPWWVYVIVAVPMVIILYSYFWCIARELTEEDWHSDEATSCALGIVIFFVGIFMILLIISIILGDLLIFFISFICLFISLYPIFAVDVINNENGDWIFCFIGAWYHHKKQLKK